MAGKERDDVLWGDETEKAIANFPVSGSPIPVPVIRWLGRLKAAAARTNADLGLLDRPIRLEVEAGLVTRIEGGEAAARLERLIEGVEGARNIGELGIGLNPLARIGADITETKKAAGTAHMAIGDNAGGYGGVVECDLHLDGMLMSPTVEVDGEPLMVDGELRL